MLAGMGGLKLNAKQNRSMLNAAGDCKGSRTHLPVQLRMADRCCRVNRARRVPRGTVEEEIHAAMEKTFAQPADTLPFRSAVCIHVAASGADCGKIRT